jgi:uncharacterized membrane protein
MTHLSSPGRPHAPRADDRAPTSATAPGAPPSVVIRRAHRLLVSALALLLALIVLSVSWELRLAPLRPGGSALVLKALPLVAVLPGLLRGKVYTLQWSSMLILAYFAEGVVRGASDPGRGAMLGWIEAALALGYFACVLAYVAPLKRAAKRAADEAASHRTTPSRDDVPTHPNSANTTPTATNRS